MVPGAWRWTGACRSSWPTGATTSSGRSRRRARSRPWPEAPGCPGAWTAREPRPASWTFRAWSWTVTTTCMLWTAIVSARSPRAGGSPPSWAIRAPPVVSEAPDGAGPASLSLAGVPCLNRPVGLTASDGHLFIADQGNQAIRDYDLRTGALTTLAGGPQPQGEEPVLRWGLLRDGVPGPLDERYAALDQPRASSGIRRGSGGGSSSPPAAAWPSSPRPGGPPALVTDPRSGPGQGGGAVHGAHPPGPGGRRRRRGVAAGAALHGTVEFIDPDGTMAQCSQASLAAGETLQVVGTFLEAGEGTVRYRGVTDTGVSQWAERKVAIQEAVRGTGWGPPDGRVRLRR